MAKWDDLERACSDCEDEAIGCFGASTNPDGCVLPPVIHDHEYDEWYCRRHWDEFPQDDKEAADPWPVVVITEISDE